MQAKAIPAILSKQDVLIASHTGSGKTLAYLLPLVSTLCGALPWPHQVLEFLPMEHQMHHAEVVLGPSDNCKPSGANLCPCSCPSLA